VIYPQTLSGITHHFIILLLFVFFQNVAFIENYRLGLHFIVKNFGVILIILFSLVSHSALGSWDIVGPLSLSVKLRTGGTPYWAHALFHLFHVVLHCFHKVFETKSIFLNIVKLDLLLTLDLGVFLDFVNVKHALGSEFLGR
jgi:hypothetical protein